MSSSSDPSPRTDDLFENSNMTFGEHLEELRVVLIRATIGIVVGFLIGMFIADDVVRFIESPLRQGLESFYMTRDIDEIREKMAAVGQTLSLEDERKIKQRGLTYDSLFLEREEVTRLIEQYQGKSEEPVHAEDDGAAELPSNDFLMIRIWRPLKTKISALSAREAFLIWVKAGLVSGVILVSPYIFYQIWIFVAAGLYPHERKYVYIYMPFSLLLFLSGAALAFFFVFEPVLDFLFSFNRWMGIDPDPRISEWISFVLLLPLGFGLSFQLPLVMLLLNRIGIFTLEMYTSQWRMAILVIFFLSMVLTPADPLSMLLMACPLSVLYFLGIGLCLWAPSGRRNPFPEVGEGRE